MNSFSITVKHLLTYLLVEATGNASLKELLALTEFGSSLHEVAPASQALVNVTGLEVRLDFAEQLLLGSHLAGALREYKRIAVVVGKRRPLRAVEIAAQELGLRQLQFFWDIQSARRWVEDSNAAQP